MAQSITRATPIMDRLFGRVTITPEQCWIWAGGKDAGGYGVIRYRGRTSRAHRVAFEVMYGPIPPGLEIDHLCRNAGCIRPTHLEAVRQIINLRRRRYDRANNFNASKTHCVHGHEYTPENTLIYGRQRRCHTCLGEQRRRRYAMTYQRHPRT